ncbi:HXXEE domain-containing protein [Nonomuraea turkmeniaca]|uniref:HXXEE domain-containing protein n=1 Tax=Nonomuraea turkmeniaca TaxID=103838 RepID=A0A5S4EY77_9ACTN|nr:HXXEE domain-containing protein [Nonomuraea turkmeniaca]TMR08629.1 HXXEE domain-containing protein [Nonomuraea turkmeniaca]
MSERMTIEVEGRRASYLTAGERGPVVLLLHGVGHLAQAAATRGYTPGAVTAPVVVIPFSVWAWRRLRSAGVPVHSGRSGLAATAAFPLVLGGVHALAHALTQPRRASGPDATPEAGRPRLRLGRRIRPRRRKPGRRGARWR